MFSVVIPTMILALPFALIRTAKFNGEYKRLAEEHKYELAVDFGFSLLKRMYRLGLEIPASLLILAYLLLFHSWEESAVIVLYVMLLWFFAGTVFFSRYGILPTMKDQYALMGKMFIIYQSLLVFLLLIPQGLSNWSGLGAAGQLMFCVLAAGLVGKSLFYVRVYPGFIDELEGRG